MKTITRREHQRAQIRREILDAASVAFATEGYEMLSMRKLAARLGYAPGTLYLYFSNKDDLLRAVVDESFAELLKTLQAIPPKANPVESLKAKMRAYIDFGLRNPNHYKCAFVLPPVKRGKESYRPQPAFGELVNAVAACTRPGLLDEKKVGLASQVLWSCIHGLTSLLIARPDFPWLSKDRLINELIEASTAGVMRNQLNAPRRRTSSSNQRSQNGNQRSSPGR